VCSRLNIFQLVLKVPHCFRTVALKMKFGRQLRATVALQDGFESLIESPSSLLAGNLSISIFVSFLIHSLSTKRNCWNPGWK
jgi:F0F1-type ATP synthase membrane subunit a